MAEKETAFSVDITLSAVITRQDGIPGDVEDFGSVLKIFSDVTLLNRHFKELEFFRVKQLKGVGDEGILTCFVFSLQELEDLKQALESGDLAKYITQYALVSGLEASLGLLPTADVQVEILLEKKEKSFRQAAAFFKKQIDEGKCDIGRKRKVKETTDQERAAKEKQPTSKKKKERKDETIGDTKCKDETIGDTKYKDETIGDTKYKDKTLGDTISPHKVNNDTQRQPNSSEEKHQISLKKKDIIKQQQEQPQRKTSASDSGQNTQTLPDKNGTQESKVGNTCSTARTKDSDKQQGQRRESPSVTANSEVIIQKEVVVNISPSFLKRSAVVSVIAEVSDTMYRTVAVQKLFDSSETIWQTGLLTFSPVDEVLFCRITVSYKHWYTLGIVEFTDDWMPMTNSFVPIQIGKYDLDDGFCNLIFHIINSLSIHGLKDAIMNTDMVFRLFHYDFSYLHGISKTIQKYIDKKGIYMSEEAFDLLGYIYGRLIVYSKGNDLHLHPETCAAILKSIRNLREGDIPSKSLSCYINIFDRLCEAAFPKSKCHFFTQFEYGFPFLPVKHFSDALDRYRNGLSDLKVSELKSIQTVLTRCLPENCTDIKVADFIEKLARHVPLTIIVLSNSDLCKIIGDPTFQGILETKVKDECRPAEKKGGVSDLLQIIDVLHPLGKLAENICSCIEESFIVILKNTKQYKSSFPGDMIERIMDSKVIFQTTSSRKLLLKVMSESQNKWLHSHFVILLKDVYTEEYGTEFLTEWTLTWFQIAIGNHCDKSSYKKPIDDLPLVYAHLQTALSAECVLKQDNLVTQLKDRAYKFMLTVSLSSLVDKVQTQDIFEHSEENQIFLDHLHRYLFRDTKQGQMHSILAKAGRSSWSFSTRKCTRLFANLLETAIESTDFEKSKETLPVFLKIAKNATFWINVIAYSKEHDFLKNNKILKKTVKHCRMFGETLMQKTLAMSCARDLLLFSKDNPDEVVDLLVSSECNSKKDQVKRCLKELDKSFEMAESDGEFLEGIVKKMKSNSGGLIVDLDLAHEKIKGKKEELMQGSEVSVSAVLDRSHWEPFSTVLTSCQTIATLVTSESFWKICKENMAKWVMNDNTVTDVPSSPEDDICSLFGEMKVGEVEPFVTIRVMKAISSQGLEEYENMWKPLFDGEDKVIGDIQTVVDVQDLKKEVSIAESFFNQKLQEWIMHAFALYSSYHKYLKKIETIRKVLTVLQYEDIGKEFDHSVQDFTCLSKQDDRVLTLRGLSKTSMVLDTIDVIVTEELENILLELSVASQLVDFIRETALEDHRNLIDAVEEHSEQSVKESTVSALIEVKRFLSPVIRDQKKEDVKDVLRTLQKSLKDSKITKLDQKVSECRVNVHGLKALFHNVANRGEVTKQIVKNVVQSGSKFIFTINDTKKCDMKLTYKSHGKTRTHTDSDIKDLRSRVLLLVNADAKDEVKKRKVKEEYEVFVHFVDDAMDIANILSQLCQSGHPKYSKTFEITLLTKEAKFHYHQFQEQLYDWKTTLAEMRQEHYWLNFFYPEQMLNLKALLESPSKDGEEEVHHLLSFTGCTTSDISEVKKIYAEEAKGQKLDTYSLRALGKTLHRLFEYKSFTKTAFPDELKRESKSVNIGDIVKKGELYVAGLNENSDLVVPTLMALYKNTTGLLPKSHQVLFCQEDTYWEDIELLLNRCLGSCNQNETEQLFSLVCIDKLPIEMQFMFVNAVKELSGKPVLFAVICRGGAHHPFLDHYGNKVHQVQHMSQQAMELCLQTLWPEVFTVMSDVPGQGKSEFIQEKAWAEGLAVSTLHLSGDLTCADMVKKISEVEMSPMNLLHIDVGNLTKPKDVDLQLFQLIVLGFLRHGSTMVKLNTKYIYIEIANTISNSLRNSLITITRFNRQFLKWEAYDNYHPSQEICSPAQVVCIYLKAYDEGNLDQTDLYFTGQNVSKPLPEQVCKLLLQKYFSFGSDMSFAVVNIFLNVLSDQLKKFSCSYFFRTGNIAGMLGDETNKKTVKSQLFKALLDVSREFAIRSVNTCREEQSSSVKSMSTSTDQDESTENLAATSASAQAMTKRVDGMIQWAESNHLILAFHNQDIQTLSALYRKKDLVSGHIKKLFETQVKKPLPDFSNLSQEELQEILQRIARFREGSASPEMLANIAKNYALTPDNLLKMILIVLRTRSQVPVIVMGETGCGKTSLIRYLANLCGIHLDVQSIHAGVDETQIIQSVKNVNEKALNMLSETVWLFLDEINTCNHLGLINTILCHHRCEGETLAPNLIVMAACNPYKLRKEMSIFTAGLESKVKADEKSRLVYRVNPLPERMVDYVWDYGSLNANDERSYIKRMVDGCVQSKLVDCLVDLLVMSQKFVRDREESGACVSLRDVNRCTTLIGWFQQNLKAKFVKDDKIYLSNKVLEVRSVVLALAHSYHSRLLDNLSRKQYRAEMENNFSKHHIEETENSIFKMIQREQSDLLERMELPPGTAMNTALKENVFVIMVCILNHIPVFVVGKPGCSKSLSLQLIKSNLRGKDSKDPYFQSLPQVYCVSYQGSESSTSDGIIKVFEKAERYKDQNKDDSVLPVVVLDEIGLAETSKFNPLKVLHSLLEPGDTELPRVAVVGISNWALDAAKMNRAIHLSRPDMDADELYNTGLSISEASVKDQQKCMSLSSTLHLNEIKGNIDSELIRAIADAYIHYTGKQKFKNFHGLRDFYSLVKFVSEEYHSLSAEDALDPEIQLSIVVKGLQRNFGGLSTEIDSVLSVFKEHLEKTLSSVDPLSWPKEMPRVLQLVEDNIKDQNARHLLLATRGESALSIIEGLLDDMGRKHVTILGSHFEEDKTDDYNYRILSQIILCMEEGVVLVLKDLESIYGSLYDMLNQNYTVVGSKKNCRIALGAYSNPLCHVHDDFRCIVLVEEDKLDMSDPPFLNRFEKQFIRLTDMLSDEEKNALVELEEWMTMCTDIQDFHFERHDVIPIDSPDMVASVVKFVFTRQHKHLNTAQKIQECKNTLLRAFSPESVVRFEHSDMPREEVELLQNKYFSLPLHHGLDSFLQKRKQETTTCLKEMIFSHSNIHTDICACFAGSKTHYQIERLSAFKSEKQLYQRVNSFWFESPHQCLIIQCAMQSDRNNILMTKTIVDKCQAEFVRSKPDGKKHVMIIMHMDRNELENSFAIVNFLGGWNISFIDILERKENSVVDLIQKPKMHLIQERRPLTNFLQKHLFWTFTLMHYHNTPRDLESLKKTLHVLTKDNEMMLFFEDMLMSTLKDKLYKEASNNWQLEVACDRLKLYTHLTLYDALEHEVAICIKHPLAAFIFKLEEASALDSITLWCKPDDMAKREVWKRLSQDKSLLDYESVPPPEGPECYDIMESVLSLRCPFSRLFIDKIETLRDPFMECLAAEYPDFDIDEITEEIRESLVSRFQEPVCQAAADMFENFNTVQFSDYVKDVCNVIFCGINLDLSEDDRTRVTEWSVSRRLSKVGKSFEENASRLHVTIWLYGTVIESELKLISVCKNLTDTNLDDMLPQQNIVKVCLDEETKISKDSFTAIPEKTNPECVAHKSEEENDGDDVSLQENVDVESMTEPEFVLDDHEEGHLDEQFPRESEEAVDIDDVEIVDKDMHLEEQKLSDSYDRENIFKGGYDPETHSKDVESPDSNDDDMKQEQTVALIDFACSQLLPSEALFDRLSEHDWINGIQLVLTLASEVSFEAKLCQSLRICSDFSFLIGTSKDLAGEYLCRIGQALTEKLPESEGIFSIVSELVNDLLDEGVPCESLQHFFSCYISSALAANTDGPLLHWTFQSLPSLVLYKDTYRFFGPTLFQTLLVELGDNDVVSVEIAIEEGETLQFMESCVAEYKDKGEPDSHLACLIMDVFQTHFCNVEFKLDSTTLDNVLRCEKLLKSQGLSLNHLVALAYLKNFLIYFSKELGKKEPIDMNIVQKINGILSLVHSEEETSENARTKALQMFFLKVTCQNAGLNRMEELCEDFASNLEFLSIHEVTTDQRLYAKEMCPMETHSEVYQHILAAYDALPEDESQIKDIAKKSKSKHEHIYNLFGVALQQIHLLQSVRQITDSERNDKVKVFYDVVSGAMCQNQCALFRNLCSFGDFNFKLLQTSSSKPSELHHSSVCILHLLCTVLAFNPNQGNAGRNSPLLLKCLQAPRDLHKLYIPGSGFKESALHESSLMAISEGTKYQACSCHCNVIRVIELKSDLVDVNCDKCKQPFQKNGRNFKLSSDRNDSLGLPGYHFVDIGCLRGEFLTVRRLSPAAFRILQFILHGCLAGSLALGFAKPDDVSQALKLSESIDPESYLSKHLEIHWSALKSLTEMGDAQAAKLINFIISDKVIKMAQENVQYDRIEEQEKFEEDFTDYINDVMQERFKKVQNDVSKYQTHHMTSTASKFEMMLTEQLPSDDRLGELPRLFMEHVKPSIENMQREFLLQKQVKDHPLMALLFEKKEDIALLRHLMPLMQWHKCVIRYGSHKLSRAECKQQSVQDFVKSSGKGSTSDHAEFQKRFDSFKMAWNDLTEKQNLLCSYNSQLPAMERIHKLVTLDKCVMMTKNSPLMQVLVALKSIQNCFLKDASIISLSTKSLSVSFFKQSEGVAVIPEVNLELVQKKQVIVNPDLGGVLKFSQICTELGHGRERQYDMHQIEGKVLVDCMMNKPLLKISSGFPMISFSGESLHKTDELFESMMQIVGHAPLDKDQKDSVDQLRDKSSSNMQTLLDYLQMTFSLLKRAPVSGRDKDQYLSEFLMTWQSLFPYRVPEVDGLCKKVRLSQILSLYGFVEDKVADDIFDGLEEKFRTQLPDYCLNHMNELVSNSLLPFQEALASALKKIVFRYLQTDHASHDDTLSPLLMEKSLWPHGVFEEAVSKSSNPKAGLLHEMQMVEHIHGTIEFLLDAIREKKMREQRKTTLLHQPLTRKTDKAQQRKKAAAKFR